MKTSHTCSPEKLISGMSPPPFAVRLLIFSLKTSAFVVLVKGPKSGFQSEFNKTTICITTTTFYTQRSTVTWVIEGHQYVGRGLLLSSSSAINNVQGNPFSLGDVVAHAACGVDDEAQHRRLGETHQPAAASQDTVSHRLRCGKLKCFTFCVLGSYCRNLPSPTATLISSSRSIVASTAKSAALG